VNEHTVLMMGSEGPVVITVIGPNPKRAAKAARKAAVIQKLSKTPPEVLHVESHYFVEGYCERCKAPIFYGERPKRRGESLRCYGC